MRAPSARRHPWRAVPRLLLLAGVLLLAAAAVLASTRSLRADGPATQREGPAASQEVPVASQEPPVASEDVPVASEEVPVATEPAPAACDPSVEVPYAEVDIETRPRLQLEVAATPQERMRGLMFREWLPWEQGMLFVFEQQGQGGFWMRNTLLPLSIAWLDLDGSIVDIQDMQPQTDDVHVPAAPYWYALETNQGWYEANGVGVGQRVLLCTGKGVPLPTPPPSG